MTGPGLTRSSVLRAALALPAVAAGASLAACGGAGQSAAPAVPAAPVEIEYWSTLPETHPEGKGRMEAFKVSEQANSAAVKIRFEQPGGSSMEKVIAASAGGTPPNVLVDRPNNAAMLFDAGIVVEHAELLKGVPAWQKVRPVLPPNFLEGTMWRGKQTCIPLYLVNAAMVYSPDHLERAGIRPPVGTTWTWNDFVDIAKRAARPPDVWGLDKAWASSQWQQWGGSNGVEYYNKDKTKIQLTQPESVATMEFLYNLTHGLGLVPPDDLGELLVKGQTVFEPNGPYRMPVFRQANVRFEPIWMPLGPQKPTPFNWASMYSMMVLKSTDAAKQKASAVAALGALADNAQVEMCKSHLGWPASKQALASPGYQALLAADKQMKTFIDMFDHTWIIPAVPSYAQTDTIRGQMMTKIYKKQDSIRNALAEAERQSQLLLDADWAKAAAK